MESRFRFVTALVPAALLLQGLSAQQKIARPDLAKVLIEAPIKRVISKEAIKKVVEAELELSFNKKVAPGLVRWHASYAKALVAAKKSGKPVLHFQLMGKLDDEFC